MNPTEPTTIWIDGSKKQMWVGLVVSLVALVFFGAPMLIVGLDFWGTVLLAAYVLAATLVISGYAFLLVTRPRQRFGISASTLQDLWISRDPIEWSNLRVSTMATLKQQLGPDSLPASVRSSEQVLFSVHKDAKKKLSSPFGALRRTTSWAVTPRDFRNTHDWVQFLSALFVARDTVH